MSTGFRPPVYGHHGYMETLEQIEDRCAATIQQASRQARYVKGQALAEVNQAYRDAKCLRERWTPFLERVGETKQNAWNKMEYVRKVQNLDLTFGSLPSYEALGIIKAPEPKSLASFLQNATAAELKEFVREAACSRAREAIFTFSSRSAFSFARLTSSFRAAV